VSLFSRRAFFGITGAAELIPPRTQAKAGTVVVTNDSALRHSAVWACLRLRADLISTMPLDVYRRVGNIQVEMPKPPILVNPGGERVDICEWMYSSQVDLDRAGNTIGLITEVNGLGLPARIDLQPLGECSVQVIKGKLRYRIGGREYEPQQVWHEKQYTIPGLEVGLSPVAYAAWSIGEYLSIQEFALDWFGNGAVPKARLKNTAKTITQRQASDVKDVYRASVRSGDIFVHGNDWEFDFISAQNAGMEWIEGKRYGVTDISRFFGAPADLIDAAVSSGSITYASITQRNLQFLIMQLGPAVYRRERALSKLLPNPRYVKLNSDAVLRMDPETRAKVDQIKIASRTLLPSEAREHDNRAPYTDAQYAEFDRLFGAPRAQDTANHAARAAEPVSPLSAVPFDNAAWAANLTYGEGAP
jgi:HK97 family phage portal protein